MIYQQCTAFNVKSYRRSGVMTRGIRKWTIFVTAVMFDYYLEKCKLKQMIHDNNFCSHPTLIKLGEVCLSYPGWERDIQEAKTHLCDSGYALKPRAFHDMIDAMKNKQGIYDGSQNDICCICLSAMTFY
jgi:hypothetical protein